MRLRVGIVTDDFGRPIRSVSQDVGPARGRAESTGRRPTFRGTVVQGEHGNAERHRDSARRIRGTSKP